MRSEARAARRYLRLALWIVALALFLFTLRSVSLSDAWSAIRSLDPSSLLALGALNATALFVFASRWWVLLHGLGWPVTLARASLYRLGAFGVAYFTPGPQIGGEPVQVLSLEKRHGVPRETAIASVALDRVLEGAVNLGYLVAASLVLLGRAGAGDVGSVAAFLGALFAVPVLYLLAIARGRRPVTALLGRFGARARGWIETSRASEATAGRFCRERPGHLALAVLASFASWGVMLLEYGVMARYLGLPLGFGDVILGLTAARVAYLLFLPAGLGVFEAGQILAVTAMSLPPALGLALSLVIRARDVLLAGAGLLWTLWTLVGWPPLVPAGRESSRWPSSTAPTSSDA